MNEYAVDKYGKKFLKHPNSNIVFNEYPPLPEYEQMSTVALNVAKKIPYARLASLDLALDSENCWKVIEVGVEHQTIRFAQYAGKPFFGAFTNEVLDYCSR